jgi:hypothetical protein
VSMVDVNTHSRVDNDPPTTDRLVEKFPYMDVVKLKAAKNRKATLSPSGRGPDTKVQEVWGQDSLKDSNDYVENTNKNARCSVSVSRLEKDNEKIKRRATLIASEGYDNHGYARQFGDSNNSLNSKKVYLSDNQEVYSNHGSSAYQPDIESNLSGNLSNKGDTQTKIKDLEDKGEPQVIIKKAL